jgi:hypothetical protein
MCEIEPTTFVGLKGHIGSYSALLPAHKQGWEIFPYVKDNFFLKKLLV